MQSATNVKSKKCRGHLSDLSDAERKSVSQRCCDEKFSSAFMVVPPSRFDQLSPQLAPPSKKDKLRPMVCDIERIIEDDRDIFKQLNVTHAQLGDALKTIARLAVHKADLYFAGQMAFVLAKLHNRPVDVPKFETAYQKILRYDKNWANQGMFESTFPFNGQTLRVFVILWGGAQICPFKNSENTFYHGYKYGARDVIVTNVQTGSFFQYSTLLPHMIKHHEFLESPMCFYRVNPTKVIEVIGKLETSKSYRVAKHKLDKWTLKFSTTRSNDDTITTREAKLATLSSIDKVMSPEPLNIDRSQPIFLKSGVAYISGDGKQLVVEKTNTITPHDDSTFAANMKKLGITEVDIAEGTSFEFENLSTSIYHWSEWFPDMPDGPKSKLALDADGPRIINIGESK